MVVRFRSRETGRITGPNRWRLWMLVIALGLVLATMRQLGKPETARRLEQIFSTPQSAVERPAPEFEVSSAKSQSDLLEFESSLSASADELTDDTSQVKDRTYFRPEERELWFEFFARLQKLEDDQLVAQSVGVVSYAQLLKQPEVYRGRLVTIHGRVKREELQQPAGNQLGIAMYHRLWIQPLGGGQWPLVVYCLELPPEFPRGENLNTQVSVTGLFFKNWSYAYDDGLGLAPVILANRFDWQPSAARPLAKKTSAREWTMAITLAAAFAAIATLLAARRTRRLPRQATAAALLQELAARETDA
ncbi:MAG: hypothetical protein KDA57_14825 [Planctomycetales bacterium]|nr:hypothetical protein [Planctomycetales bacterium]